MKKFLTSFFLLLIIVFQLSFVSEVKSADEFCGNSSDTVIVFGNGIMNTEEDANDSRIILRNKLHAILPPEQFALLEFDIAYNKSYGFMSDLYESLKQRVVSDNYSVSFWRWIGNIDVLPDLVQNHIKDMVSTFDISEHYGQEDISNHISLYRTSVAEGKTVLVVSHSQGNLFANAAYQDLYQSSNPIPSGSFGIVGVASPASFVAGDGPYTTLIEDAIIGAIAATSAVVGTVTPLNPNITNIGDGTESGDWKNHSFIDSYMVFGSRSEGQILNDILYEMSTLVPPNQIAQDGVITVTLTWNEQPDIDLHVFEPNGIHVYYVNPQGSSGYLDVDDVDGFGPEHFFVGCGNLEIGTYVIGVNYYYGSAPESALVQIKAGSSIRSFSVSLPEALGSNGDNAPFELAEVIVSGNEISGYSFDIRSL